MPLTMNGPIGNLIALGVITLVALFPSPDDLKTAIDPRPELVEQTGPRVTPIPPPGAVSFAAPTMAPTNRLSVAFPSSCVDTSTWGVEDLDGCAIQLASYIEMSNLRPGRTLLAATSSDYNFTEEARASLAELCRSQWAAELTGRGTVSTACDVLR